VRQRRCPFGSPLRAGHVAVKFAEAALLYTPLHQVEGAGDARRQVIEVMGEAAGELADRLHLLALPQRFLRLLRLRLTRFDVTEVPSDGDEVHAVQFRGDRSFDML